MNKSILITSPDGVISWRNHDGQLHKEDGPALIYPDGTTYWYLNGLLHRTDGPAVIYSNGFSQFYLNGLFIKRVEWEFKRLDYLIQNNINQIINDVNK